MKLYKEDLEFTPINSKESISYQLATDLIWSINDFIADLIIILEKYNDDNLMLEKLKRKIKRTTKSSPLLLY